MFFTAVYTLSIALLFPNIVFVASCRSFESKIISTCERKSDVSSFSPLTRGAIAFLWESVSSGREYFITALRGPYLSAGSPLWRNAMDGWKAGCKGTRWLNIFAGHRQRSAAKCGPAGDVRWWRNQILQHDLLDFHFETELRWTML